MFVSLFDYNQYVFVLYFFGDCVFFVDLCEGSMVGNLILLFSDLVDKFFQLFYAFVLSCTT